MIVSFIDLGIYKEALENDYLESFLNCPLIFNLMQLYKMM